MEDSAFGRQCGNISESLIMDQTYQKMDIFLDAGRLALLKGLLESSDIQFYVNNENFSQAYGLAVTPEVFVETARAFEAREMIKDYLF